MPARVYVCVQALVFVFMCVWVCVRERGWLFSPKTYIPKT